MATVPISRRIIGALLLATLGCRYSSGSVAGVLRRAAARKRLQATMWELLPRAADIIPERTHCLCVLSMSGPVPASVREPC